MTTEEFHQLRADQIKRLQGQVSQLNRLIGELYRQDPAHRDLPEAKRVRNRIATFLLTLTRRNRRHEVV